MVSTLKTLFIKGAKAVYDEINEPQFPPSKTSNNAVASVAAVALENDDDDNGI